MIYKISGYQKEGNAVLFPRHCSDIVEYVNRIRGIKEIKLTTSGMRGAVDMRSIIGLMSVAPVRGDLITILIDTEDSLSVSEVGTIVSQLKLIENPDTVKVL